MGFTLFDYEKNPAKIYEKSFETILGEADLERFSQAERALVIRLIHACGMVDLVGDVVLSDGAVEAGRLALEKGADIICDVEMVRRGIIQNRLPADNEILCRVASKVAKTNSKQMETTLSAGAMASFEDRLEGSIVAIGNAPTALFHLLEMLAKGAAAPALIIGCPVGFVGAVESKEALIAHAGGVPFITVRGRRGGSAIAAAAVNGLFGALTNQKPDPANEGK